jgi:CubicO group peptidase (beta-lactamase class C family)
MRPDIPGGGACNSRGIALRLAEDDIFACRAGTPPGAGDRFRIAFGFLTGEVVRRITGESPGTVFREEIAEPPGAEIPAVNGHGSVRSAASIHFILANGGMARAQRIYVGGGSPQRFGNVD